MLAERCVAHSLFIDHAGVVQDVVVQDKPPIRYLDMDFPSEGRLERVDYRHISRLDGEEQPVQVIFVGELHPREHLIANIARKRFAKEQFSRVEAWNPHILAAFFGQRRDYVRPFVQGETIYPVPKRERIIMKNGRRVKREYMYMPENDKWVKRRNGVMGRKIDVNRKFKIPHDAHSWEDVLAAVSYPEAQLLLYMMRDNPELRYLFSFHEDMENGHNAQLKPGENSLYEMVCIFTICAQMREVTRINYWLKN